MVRTPALSATRQPCVQGDDYQSGNGGFLLTPYFSESQSPPGRALAGAAIRECPVEAQRSFFRAVPFWQNTLMLFCSACTLENPRLTAAFFIPPNSWAIAETVLP